MYKEVQVPKVTRYKDPMGITCQG